GELLRGVDLYKVGHHGSRNATPRSLFGLWDPAVPTGRRTALMSTRTGVYPGHAGTEVPRQTLVEALATRMTLLTTDGLPSGERFVEVVADTSGQAGFQRVPPPSRGGQDRPGAHRVSGGSQLLRVRSKF